MNQQVSLEEIDPRGVKEARKFKSHCIFLVLLEVGLSLTADNTFPRSSTVAEAHIVGIIYCGPPCATSRMSEYHRDKVSIVLDQSTRLGRRSWTKKDRGKCALQTSRTLARASNSPAVQKEYCARSDSIVRRELPNGLVEPVSADSTTTPPVPRWDRVFVESCFHEYCFY